MLVAKTAAEAMRRTLTLLSDANEIEPRGKKTKEILSHTVHISNPRNRIIIHPDRNYNIFFNIAEALSHISGINSVEFLNHFNNKISEFSDNELVFYGNYGQRMFHQIPKLISKLSASPKTRQAVLNIYKSQDAFEETKDTPCTIALDFKIRNGKLHLHTFMRSNDIIWGFQYDVFAFTLIQEIIANTLNIEVGGYTHTATSMHIYEKHWNFIDSRSKFAEYEMPKLRLDYDDFMSIAKIVNKMVCSKSIRETISNVDNYKPILDFISVIDFFNYKEYGNRYLEGNSIPTWFSDYMEERSKIKS